MLRCYDVCGVHHTRDNSAPQFSAFAPFFAQFSHTVHQAVFPSVCVIFPILALIISQKTTVDNRKNPRDTPFFHVDY